MASSDGQALSILTSGPPEMEGGMKAFSILVSPGTIHVLTPGVPKEER